MRMHVGGVWGGAYSRGFTMTTPIGRFGSGSVEIFFGERPGRRQVRPCAPLLFIAQLLRPSAYRSPLPPKSLAAGVQCGSPTTGGS